MEDVSPKPYILIPRPLKAEPKPHTLPNDLDGNLAVLIAIEAVEHVPPHSKTLDP